MNSILQKANKNQEHHCKIAKKVQKTTTNKKASIPPARIANSLAPPSCWMRAGRPSCSWSRIATALFSQTALPLFHCSLHKVAFWGEASVNFQHMSENATPATEFAPCHHLTQPCHAIYKARNRTRLKCCACHKNCNTSSKNVTKGLRLPDRTIFHTLQNTSEFHKEPRLPRETKQRHV